MNIVEEEGSFEGVVTYIEPFFYKDDDITYVLADNKGDYIILLKSDDQKLAVSEGHFVTAYGQVKKTSEKKEDYLMVDRIVIRNVSN